MNSDITLRLATSADIPTISALMQAAIRENMKPFLSPSEIEAAAETMGVDKTLIDDGTYFVVESGSQIAACGGWGKRKTLYGGSHAPTQDNTSLNPETDAARIRAMYTHPDFTRRGFARRILACSEDAARNARFRTIELGSTITGRHFYESHGYQSFDQHTYIAGNCVEKTTILMRKALDLSPLALG